MRRTITHTQLVDSLLELIIAPAPEGSRQASLIVFGGQGNCRKTSIGTELQSRMEQQGLSSVMIEIDDYARPRIERLAGKYSGYDPRTFETQEFHAGLASLTRGVAIIKPHYDHRSGDSCAYCQVPEHTHVVEPAGLTIAVGVYPDLLRKDTSLHPDLAVMFIRKGLWSFFSRIKRDVTRRNYTYISAVQNYLQMRRDFLKFMKPAVPCYTHICLVGQRRYRLDTREKRCS